MSKLISGKEALIALANGKKVEYESSENNWFDVVNDVVSLDCFLKDHLKFRIKPRTITINGIEVPGPIKGRPVDGETYFILSGTNTGYTSSAYTVPSLEGQYIDLYGYWENEEEIKQVVAALRKVFEVQP